MSSGIRLFCFCFAFFFIRYGNAQYCSMKKITETLPTEWKIKRPILCLRKNIHILVSLIKYFKIDAK